MKIEELISKLQYVYENRWDVEFIMEDIQGEWPISLYDIEDIKIAWEITDKPVRTSVVYIECIRYTQ